MGIEEASGANFPEKKKRKERIFRRLQTSPIQVVKFCSSASSLVFCLQVPRYICYIIKTARKKQKKKERKVSSPWLAFQYCDWYGNVFGVRGLGGFDW